MEGQFALGVKTQSKAEVNYAQIEKELLAVVFAMERFGHYTFGRHVHCREWTHCPTADHNEEASGVGTKALAKNAA